MNPEKGPLNQVSIGTWANCKIQTLQGPLMVPGFNSAQFQMKIQNQDAPRLPQHSILVQAQDMTKGACRWHTSKLMMRGSVRSVRMNSTPPTGATSPRLPSRSVRNIGWESLLGRCSMGRTLLNSPAHHLVLGSSTCSPAAVLGVLNLGTLDL